MSESFVRVRISKPVAPPLDALAPDYLANHCNRFNVPVCEDLEVLQSRLSMCRAIPILRVGQEVELRVDVAAAYERSGIAVDARLPVEIERQREAKARAIIDDARRRVATAEEDGNERE